MTETSTNLTIFDTSSSNKIHAYIQEATGEDYFDPRLPNWIPAVIFVIGIFGNFMSILVFLQKKMRKNSAFIYLAFLCIVDLCVILFGLGEILIFSYFRILIKNESFIVCRIQTFLVYMFSHLSSFILASVSVDRAIASNCLNFAKRFCKPSYAYKVLLLNVILAVIINFHSLLFLGFEQDNFHYGSNDSSFQCISIPDSGYRRFIDPYFEIMGKLHFFALLKKVHLMDGKKLHQTAIE